MRPVRTTLNSRSLSYLGIPKKFHNKELEQDFKTYQDSGLKKVKTFVSSYIKNIDLHFKNCEGILFYGRTGVGKSFVSSLILKEAYRKRYSCMRVTVMQYINRYAEMWGIPRSEKETAEEDFNKNYRDVEFLVLEEIGKEIDSKVAIPILEECLRYREERGLVTIMCTNLTPDVIEQKYGSSIFSLMKGNVTPIKIEAKDRREEYFRKR